MPLYYFIGKASEDRKELNNRVRTGLIITFGVFLVLAAIMLMFADPLLSLMAADSTIIEASATYIRIESIANIFSMLSNFALVVLVTLNKDKYVYIITASKVALCVVADIFLVSTLPVSANLGVNGIGVSNILVNALLLVVTIILLYREGVKFSKLVAYPGWNNS